MIMLIKYIYFYDDINRSIYVFYLLNYDNIDKVYVFYIYLLNYNVYKIFYYIEGQYIHFCILNCENINKRILQTYTYVYFLSLNYDII